MRLIDGEALWEKCYDFHLELNETDTEIEKSAKTLAEILVRQSIRRMIDTMPTIDTEVYYCNWIERNGKYWCSECGSIQDIPHNYCPCCGCERNRIIHEGVKP